ncbi:unnamed protein product [Vitrella brassicaformis CCMP3155]|uniref:SET domain-containing protein n=2 Tax=Vitrella brassicaformis TaxID=1169539 RepID=A0A0G4G444_VITBC|nr:unnamed protein product [Vitrella brassicaformis CCMP3155]|mmetsp:Transcript_35517/g.102053  ORF Transcript_35517/g.102053 Transcript_35517/m.102053 type:complete len:361 (-) Transcript_35517:220-1302(-)|eukprot:CEM23205.1 unnamed protein product [Vitrella brassicaformis CCMP3155]
MAAPYAGGAAAVVGADAFNELDEYRPFTSAYDFSIVHHPNKGKAVRAKRALASDYDVLIEIPLVCWPLHMFSSAANESQSLSIPWCEQCLKILPDKTADEAGAPLFCSVTCEQQGGQWVKMMQKGALARLRGWQREHGKDSPVTVEAVARCIARVAGTTCQLLPSLRDDGRAAEGDALRAAFSLACRPFERLVAPHTAEVADFDVSSATALLSGELRGAIAEHLSDEELTATLVSSDTVSLLLGQLMLNAQSLTIAAFVPQCEGLCVLKAAGVCVLQSSFNHSCVPNCAVGSLKEDSTLTVTTLREISAGEELCISYIDCSLPLASRQEKLMHYLFVCECPKCLEQRGIQLEGHKAQTSS